MVYARKAILIADSLCSDTLLRLIQRSVACVTIILFDDCTRSLSTLYRSRVSMKFCSECAHPVTHSIPQGRQPAALCLQSLRHHSLSESKDGARLDSSMWKENGDHAVLLCKRAIEPRRGYWTLPAGFMENNETTQRPPCEKRLKKPAPTLSCTSCFR
jgi:hypothetical protein